MSKKILILYASVDGQTRKIIEYINQKIASDNFQVAIVDIESDQTFEILDYDFVIIASSIRYGKHHPKILEYIHNNYQLLNSISTAFISVNLVARKPEKSEPNTNPYVIKFLQGIRWKPQLTTVFAGVLDYQKYGFWDRLMIRLIMKMTKGPTDSQTKIEYTNWDKVDAFTMQIKSFLTAH